MTGTAGLYGNFQGIVGRALPELHGLTIPQLEEGTNSEATEEAEPDEGTNHE